MLTPNPNPVLLDFRACSFNIWPLPCAAPGRGVVSACFSETEGRATPMDRPFYHLPVLHQEVLHFLAPQEGRLFVDGTLGGGGHTEALLEAGAEVKAIDRDAEARAYAAERLARFGPRVELVAGRFGEVARLAAERDWPEVDGFLLDIGVSSRQLDAAERGFSFQQDGPLDMRMGESELTAAQLVNEWPEEELRRIFWELGEEKSARRIAAWIVAERVRQPFTRTLELANGIESLLGRRGRIHPATKVFQALRMAVNDELGELRAALLAAPGLLKSGGRLAVITFHSLEDRLVKNFFRERSAESIDRPEWPEARPNPDRVFRLLTRKAVSASGLELEKNPRARSAKLRVVERL